MVSCLGLPCQRCHAKGVNILAPIVISSLFHTQFICLLIYFGTRGKNPPFRNFIVFILLKMEMHWLSEN